MRTEGHELGRKTEKQVPKETIKNYRDKVDADRPPGLAAYSWQVLPQLTQHAKE
jgi:hypothetical protein